MIALILAAGYATRLYPLTKDRPKALLPIHGRPMLDYITDQIDSLPDVTRIVVVSNHRFAASFRAWAASRTAGHPITVLDDGTTEIGRKLGAVGDIRFAIDQAEIDEELLIIAGDNLFTFELSDALAFYRETNEDTILVGRLDPGEDARRFAVVELDAKGYVTNLEEKPVHPRSDVVAYAVYFYPRSTLPLISSYLDEGNNPDAPGHFTAWLYSRKKVRAYFFTGECIDIGTPEVYKRVCERVSGVHDT